MAGEYQCCSYCKILETCKQYKDCYELPVKFSSMEACVCVEDYYQEMLEKYVERRIIKTATVLKCGINVSLATKLIPKMAESITQDGKVPCPCSVVVEGFPVVACPCKDGIKAVKRGEDCHCGILMGVKS